VWNDNGGLRLIQARSNSSYCHKRSAVKGMGRIENEEKWSFAWVLE
jgi:hypothetical protein